MGTNYIAPIWRMPRNANKDKLSNYSVDFKTGGAAGRHINCGTDLFTDATIPSISISVWIKTSAAGAIMSKDLATNTNRNFLFQIAGTQLYWQTTTGSGSSFPDSLTVPQSEFDLLDSEWHHIVVTYNTGSSSGVGEKKIYIDGLERAAAPNATFNPLYNKASVPIDIGRRGDGSRYFYDDMSQVCIFNYCLNSTQVNYLYNLNNPMAITGGKPVAYWPLGDNSNPNAPGSFPNISAGADSVFDFIPNDYIDLGTNLQDILNSNQNTISIWFRSDTASNFDTLFSQGNGSSVGYRLFVSGTTLSLNRSEQSPTNDRQTVDIPLEHQKWNHLVLVTNTSNSTKLIAYLNGSSAGTYSTGTITYNNGGSQAWIGGQFGINQYWDGQVANIQIWNTDLSSAEVNTLYNNGQPLKTGTQPQESNLRAWYKLDQSANWEADSASSWQIPDNRSAYPKSFDFNGSSDIISISPALSISTTQPYTISAWINLDSTSNQTIISGNASGGTNDFTVPFGVRSVSGSFAALVSFEENSSSIYRLGNNIAKGELENKWHHVMLVKDGVNCTFYYDGQPNGTASFTTTPPATINLTTIGKGFNNFYLNGGLSNLAIWNSDQSAEISNIYNNGIPATSYTNTPLAWYKLDDTSIWYENTGQWGIPNAASTNTQIINFSN